MPRKLPTVPVLSFLARNEAESIPDIAYSLGLTTEKVRTTVKFLVGDGRVEALGTSSTNARCYGITAAGRVALANTTDEN